MAWGIGVSKDSCRKAWGTALYLIQDERAQGTTEYILLLSVVITATIAFFKGLLGLLDQGILTLGGTLEGDLKTGSAPTQIWKN